MSQCGNNNELARQQGGFCTTWSLVAKGRFPDYSWSRLAYLHQLSWNFEGVWAGSKKKKKLKFLVNYKQERKRLRNENYQNLNTMIYSLFNSPMENKRRPRKHWGTIVSKITSILFLLFQVKMRSFIPIITVLFGTIALCRGTYCCDKYCTHIRHCLTLLWFQMDTTQKRPWLKTHQRWSWLLWYTH